MFDKIRRPGRSGKQGRVKKFFQFLVMGVICLIFVFLIPIGTPIGGEGIFARVGREAVRAGDFQPVYENLRRQMGERLSQLDDSSYERTDRQLRRRALKQLVERELLSQGARQAGFVVGKQELAGEIRSFPAFQRDGRFLQSAYLNFLKARGLRASRFEKRIQKSLVVEKTYRAFQKAAPETEAETSKARQKGKWQVRLNYALLSAGDIEEEKLEPAVQAGDLKAVTRFLKQNQSQWEKTEEFSPVTPFGMPPAGNESFMEALLSHLPKRGLIPRLIREDDKIYLIHVLSFRETVSESKAPPLKAFWQKGFGTGERLLESYMEQQRRETKIRLAKEFQEFPQGPAPRLSLWRLLKDKTWSVVGKLKGGA